MEKIIINTGVKANPFTHYLPTCQAPCSLLQMFSSMSVNQTHILISDVTNTRLVGISALFVLSQPPAILNSTNPLILRMMMSLSRKFQASPVTSKFTCTSLTSYKRRRHYFCPYKLQVLLCLLQDDISFHNLHENAHRAPRGD